MDRNVIQNLALKIIKIVSFLAGIAFTAYNLSSFKVDKYGYFYNDDNQLWLAFGLTNLALYYLLKNWKNL